MGSRHGTPNSKRRRGLIHPGLVAALLSAATLSACGDDGDDGGAEAADGGSGEDCTIGFSHPFGEVPVVGVVNGLYEDIGKAAGCEVLVDSTQGGDLQDQLTTLDTWITQGVDAIIVNPIQPSAYESVAQRAEDAGIIWTTYGAQMDVGAGGVGLPAKESGTATGEAVVEWMLESDPDAEVLILTAPEYPDFTDRVEIPIQMIEDETDGTIVSEQAANEQTSGLTVTETALQANPDISVVVAFNDDAALGAAEAFRKAGDLDPDEVFIIGQDGAKDALLALQDEDSYFRASAAIDFEDLVQQSVDLTLQAVNGDGEPGDDQTWVDLPPIVVTHEDTDQVEKLLETLS